MMNGISMKKLQKILLLAGVVLAVLGLVCMLSRMATVKSVSDFLGYDLTAKETREMMKSADSVMGMFGSDLASLMDISGFRLLLMKFSLNFAVPLLVIGLLLCVCGVAMKFLGSGSARMEKAKEGISQGMDTVAAKVKGVVDMATVKCPRCGKVYTGKTTFCSACGEKLPEPEPTRKVCPGCGTENKKSAAFCSACGTKLPELEPAKRVCPACGTVNKKTAAFCFACGTKLTAEAPEAHSVNVE